MQKEYINIDTGEVLTKEQMIDQWKNEYDGGDPTNGVSIWEQYKEVKL